jgi:hypothetical protein
MEPRSAGPRVDELLRHHAIRRERALKDLGELEREMLSAKSEYSGIGGHVARNARDLLYDPASGAHFSSGIDLWRDWHWERVGCAENPQVVPSR